MYLSVISLLALLCITSCTEDKFLEDELVTSEETVNLELHEMRSCGKDHHMEELLSNPEYRKAYEKKMQHHLEFVEGLLDSRAVCSSPVTIPIAIHFQGVSGTDLACLTPMVEEAVAALNKDFQGSNDDISDWTNTAASSFPNISNGEACLEFVIANTNHPSGYGLANGDLAITLNKTSGDEDSNWSGYLNVFVKNAGGSLGYAPLGGSGNGDGVVISKDHFSTGASCGNVGPGAPFDLGRTLTHEVGHYLLLDHIWGNGCNVDDGISDTPNQNSDYSGCPNIGASSCGSTDLHMNYMDYTDDACMYMFTAGQASVTENYVASSLGNITSNAASVISGSSGGGGGGTTPCAMPATTSAQVLSNTSVEITWEGNSSATNYQLRYRVNGTTTWTSVFSPTPTKIVTGLTAGTTYDYTVRTLCPSGWTGFTAIQAFTTTGSAGGGGTTPCAMPTTTSAQVLSNTSVEINWEGNTSAIQYQLRYRVDGTTTWTSVFSPTPTKIVTGLTAGTTYDYRVRTQCPSGWTGFTTIQEFTTTGSTGGGGTSCDKPGYSDTEYLTISRTKVTWEAMPQAIRYSIRYRKVGTTTWTTKYNSAAQKTLTNLQSGATYEYKLRTKCPAGWTTWTGLATFDQSNGSTGGGGSSSNTVFFNLTLDDYGSETSWEVVDDNNTVLLTGGPYDDGTNGMVISQTFALADGCYTLYVDDSYGDGICCDYGNGSFELLDINNTQVGYSNGTFGSYDYLQFCVTNNVVTFQGGEKDAKATGLQAKNISSAN